MAYMFFTNLQCVVSCSANTCFVNTNLNSYDLWHKCFGHSSSRIVQHVMHTNNVPFNKNVSLCDLCVQAKSRQLPFSSSHTIYITLLQLIFVDIWGLSHIVSTTGSLYYIAFLDAFSRFTWIYLLTSKSQATDAFFTLQSSCGNANWSQY